MTEPERCLTGANAQILCTGISECLAQVSPSRVRHGSSGKCRFNLMNSLVVVFSKIR